MKVNLVAHPNSKRPRIEKDILDTLHVYVREPARDNEANIAIIGALALYFGVPKSTIKLLKGQKSKSKTFEIITNQ